jgi:cytochrome c oxidase subunit 3
MILFLAAMAAIGGWWLSRQRLTSMPWLEVGALGVPPGTEASPWPAATLGLGFFLAVAGCLFALLSSAYLMRVDGDARRLMQGVRLLPTALLWVNTAVLAAGSVALHRSAVAARRGQRDVMLGHLATGGVAALAFVAGQGLAWRMLMQAGQFLALSPANAFFYLLTGVHGLHVLGGLAALAKNLVRAARGAALQRLRPGVELCAIYWHFLLLVWAVVFGLLMGGADALTDLCQALVR